LKAQRSKEAIQNEESDKGCANSSYLLKKNKLTDLSQLTQIYHSPIILALEPKKRNINKKEVAKTK